MKSLLLLFITVFTAITLKAQLAVTPTTDASSFTENLPADNGGITISNPVYSGPGTSAGLFSEGTFGFSSGFILSTGDVNEAPGPNTAAITSTGYEAPGNELLSEQAGFVTFDASVLSFEFIAEGSEVSISFIFASEEYDEYVCSAFNDAFAFILNGPGYENENVALIPGTTLPVSINNLNSGSPGSLGNAAVCSPEGLSNSALYVNNNGGLPLSYDGYSVPLTATFSVTPGETYSFTIGVADAFDDNIDSAVFIEEGSMTSSGCDAGTIAYTDTDETHLSFCIEDLPASLDIEASPEGFNASYTTVLLSGEQEFISEFDAESGISLGDLTPGEYAVAGISYTGNLLNLQPGTQLELLEAGNCISASELLTFSIIVCDTCEVSAGMPDSNVGENLCLQASQTEVIFETEMTSGESQSLAVADENGIIIALPEGLSVDFAGLGAGLYQIYSLAWEGEVMGLTIGESLTEVSGDCLASSEPYLLNILDCAPPPDEYCDFFQAFYANHGPGISGSDIYQVNFESGNAELDFMRNVGFETHIGFNSQEFLLYLVNASGAFVQIYDYLMDEIILEQPIAGDLDQLYAVLYHPEDQILYVGDSNSDEIYTLDPVTGETEFYANAPVSGGDLVYLEGKIYLATRQGNRLYEVVEGGEAIDLGPIPSHVNGMSLANDLSSFYITNFGSSFLSRISPEDASILQTIPAFLDGEVFTFSNGDMASGCYSPEDPVYCAERAFYYHQPMDTTEESILYRVDFIEDSMDFIPVLAGMGNRQIAIDPDGGLVYLAGEGEMSFYDSFTGQVLASVPLTDSEGNTLTGIRGAACLDYNEIYVLDETSIYEVDFATGVASVITTGLEPGGDIFDFNGDLWFLGTNSISRIAEPVSLPLPAEIINPNGAGRLDDGSVLISTANGDFHKIFIGDENVSATYPSELISQNGDLATTCAEPVVDPFPGECYATQVEEYIQGSSYSGGNIQASRTDANQALGEPERIDQLVFVSLGYGGSITLSFDGIVPNLAGDDLEIVETTYNNDGCDSYPEFADVYVSQNGVDFFFAKTVCRADPFVDISDAGGFSFITEVRISNNDQLSTSPDAYDVDGVVALHNCQNEDDENPPVVELAPEPGATLTSYPNPSSDNSTAVFRVKDGGRASLEVFDLSGRRIAMIFNQNVFPEQEYRADFDTRFLPEGVYIYRLTTEKEVTIAKFIVTRNG